MSNFLYKKNPFKVNFYRGNAIEEILTSFENELFIIKLYVNA
jgi:hypothetical protein